MIRRSGFMQVSLGAVLLAAGVAAAEPIALTGATVHTAIGPSIENATLVMDDGRITAVGTQVAPPANARIVPCAGKHIWPGYVASFTTLGLTEVGSVRGTNDMQETGSVNPNIRAEVQINPESDLLPVARVSGVTSALVVPRGGAIAGTSALIHLVGWTHEDMTVRSPVALHVQWPAMGINRALSETRTEEDQKKERDQQIRQIRKSFDDARAYWRAREAEGEAAIPRHDQDVKWDAMRKALRGEIPVVFHCSALNQIQAVLKFVDEQELKNLILADAYDAWRVADELKQRDVAVILAGTLGLPRRSYESYDMAMSLPARLHAAGVRFCISEGGGASNVRNLPQHAAMAAAFGLPRDEALRSVTLYPARILGAGDRLGSIEPGKVADLVVGDGDPLEVTTHVEQVYIAGKAISMETRQTRLFEKYDHRPRGSKARPRKDTASLRGNRTGAAERTVGR